MDEEGIKKHLMAMENLVQKVGARMEDQITYRATCAVMEEFGDDCNCQEIFQRYYNRIWTGIILSK